MPDIKYRFELIDIFLCLTVAINKDIISRTINIIQKLAKWLELLDKIIRSKFNNYIELLTQNLSVAKKDTSVRRILLA